MARCTIRFLLGILGFGLLAGGCPDIQLPGIQEGWFNSNPRADAGPDQSGAPGETFVLDASGSSDPDGDSLSYKWTKVSGPAVTLLNANQMQASFTAAFAGVYEFALTISDGRGGTGQDTVRISVATAGGQQEIPIPEPLPSPQPEPEPGPEPPPITPTALVRSTFDLDSEGWSITNNSSATTPLWSPEGGRTGGHIYILDQLSSWKQYYWNAPSAFLGDVSAAYGGTITYHVFSDRVTTTLLTRNNMWQVILTGAGTKLVIPLETIPGQSGWTAYSVRLDTTAGWRHLATAAGATEDDIRDVLGSLVQLEILGDYWGGAGNRGGLDDVAIYIPD